ncbi:MAG: hypothetical protein WC343_12455 [Bacilli bacterium]
MDENEPFGDTNGEWYPSPGELTWLYIILSFAAMFGVCIGVFIAVFL